MTRVAPIMLVDESGLFSVLLLRARCSAQPVSISRASNNWGIEYLKPPPAFASVDSMAASRNLRISRLICIIGSDPFDHVQGLALFHTSQQEIVHPTLVNKLSERRSSYYISHHTTSNCIIVGISHNYVAYYSPGLVFQTVT